MNDEYYLVESRLGGVYFVSVDDATPEEIESDSEIAGDGDRVIGAFDNVADGIDLVREQNYVDEVADDIIKGVQELGLPED